jgi:hypothetical protein
MRLLSVAESGYKLSPYPSYIEGELARVWTGGKDEIAATRSRNRSSELAVAVGRNSSYRLTLKCASGEGAEVNLKRLGELTTLTRLSAPERRERLSMARRSLKVSDHSQAKALGRELGSNCLPKN